MDLNELKREIGSVWLGPTTLPILAPWAGSGLAVDWAAVHFPPLFFFSSPHPFSRGRLGSTCRCLLALSDRRGPPVGLIGICCAWVLIGCGAGMCVHARGSCMSGCRVREVQMGCTQGAHPNARMGSVWLTARPLGSVSHEYAGAGGSVLVHGLSAFRARGGGL